MSARQQMRPNLPSDHCHPIEEFSDVPWAALIPERCGIDWCFGWGGYGLDHQDVTLTTFRPDGSSDVWEMPRPIGAMLRLAQKVAANQARRTMRAFLED